MIFMNTIKKLISNSFFWRRFRYRMIVRSHAKVAAYWKPIIKAYSDGRIQSYNIESPKDFGDKKIIWQYWGQGFDDKSLPDAVKICMASVDKYKGEYQIIRLSDETIKEYMDLPDFVWEKRNRGIFSRTHFSDLLRLCLLATYGGVWLDATIFLTQELPIEYTEYDFFMYQRDNDEAHKEFWMQSYAYYWGWNVNYKVRALTSIFFAKKNTHPIHVMRDLLMYYWQKENRLIDYFILQILFNELVEQRVIENCPIVNDTYPHILQTMINGMYPWMTFDDLIKIVPIHKMTYFDETGLNKLRTLLKHGL